MAQERLRHRQRLVHTGGRIPAKARGGLLPLCADDDHLAEVLTPLLAPVPHVEWVDAMVRPIRAVEVAVARIIGELRLESALELKGVARLRQQAMEELDIRWML